MQAKKSHDPVCVSDAVVVDDDSDHADIVINLSSSSSSSSSYHAAAATGITSQLYDNCVNFNLFSNITFRNPKPLIFHLSKYILKGAHAASKRKLDAVFGWGLIFTARAAWWWCCCRWGGGGLRLVLVLVVMMVVCHPAAFIYLTPCSMNASGDCVKNARSAQAPASSVSGGGRAFAAVAGGLVAHEDVGRKTPKKARVWQQMCKSALMHCSHDETTMRC
jgi:hypothetical protein